MSKANSILVQKTCRLLVVVAGVVALLPDAGAQTYSGHGGESVSPEVLAKYAAPALDSNLSGKIQSMFDVRSPGMGTITEDGKALFFSWQVTGTSQIWKLDAPKGFPIQLTGGEAPTTNRGLTPDGRYVLVTRGRGGAEYDGLFLLPTKGGALQEVYMKDKVKIQSIIPSRDSKFIYFAANDIKPESYALYRYTIATKSKELLFSDEGNWSIEDIRGGEEILLAKWLGGAQIEVYTFSLRSKKLTARFGQGEVEDYYSQFAAQPGSILTTSNKFGDFRRLYLVSPEGKFSPITPEQKHDVTDFSIDEAHQRILYTINDQGFTRLFAMDAKTFKPALLPQLPAADHIKFGATTVDGRFVTLSVEAGNAPPTSYVYDWKTKKLAQWVIPSTPEIDTSKFASTKLEFYPARDGTQIPMLVRRPDECAKELCPVVVYFHGGPESQSRPGFDKFAQLIVDAGMIYVAPNVRGSDGYGKKWLDSDNGPKRLNVITDIEDCSKFIRANWKRGGVSPKIGISGASYGGYSTLIGMTMFAGAFDAGVASVGMSNLITFLMNTAPYRRILRISEYGDPEKDKDALLKLSPITYVDRVTAPLMILQGANDPRVPAGEAIQLHDALTKRNIPSQLIIFPDEGHGASKRLNQVLEIGHTVGFFEKHLKRK